MHDAQLAYTAQPIVHCELCIVHYKRKPGRNAYRGALCHRQRTLRIATYPHNPEACVPTPPQKKDAQPAYIV